MVSTRGAIDISILSGTDAGRDVLVNSPDGWEVEQPWLWWTGDESNAGTPGAPIWGNPIPGAETGIVFRTLPAVTRCTSIICGTIAGLPWQIMRGWDRLDTPDWIADPQALRLDGRVINVDAVEDVRLSAVEFWTDWIRSALWYGDGYVYVPVRDATGAPKPPLWQINPFDMRVQNGAYWVGDTQFRPGEIIHLRGEPPYGQSTSGDAPGQVGAGHGSGVLTRHARDLGLSVMVRGYAAQQYRSGVPAGYLKSSQPHMDETKANDLKAKWISQHGGRRNIAVLNATTDFTPIQVSPLDAQLDSARQWSLRDIALAFGVPNYMLGVPGDRGTYANVESRMIELRMFTLLPWMRRIESVLDAQFPRSTTIKIQSSGLERADTAARYAAYQVALSAGVLTIDEVRAMEDRPPLNVAELDAYAGQPQDQGQPTPPPVLAITGAPGDPGNTDALSSPQTDQTDQTGVPV